MKSKFIYHLFILCALLLIGTLRVNAQNLINKVEISLSTNDTPIKYPSGSEQEHRSIPVPVPISAFLCEQHYVEVDFYQPVGEVEITVSQNGIIVYSSTEKIETPMLKSIQLPTDLSGSFLLEIGGNNGAYIWGYFDIF